MKVPVRSRYLFLIIIFLVIILGSLYYLYDDLGGFDEIKVYELDGMESVIIGKEYIGKQTGSEIEEYFSSARAMVSENKLDGNLAVINYKNDTLPDNMVHMYIGVQLKTDMAEIPSDFEVRKLRSDRRLGVFLSMHPVVRPSPSRVTARLEDKAQEKGLKLQNFILELHYPDNSMAVEAWAE